MVTRLTWKFEVCDVSEQWEYWEIGRIWNGWYTLSLKKGRILVYFLVWLKRKSEKAAVGTLI